ncbi:insulinase family protein [Rickettsiales bacterium]|nr:insulinase family protein [Rickettsiales bacterium]
MNYRCRRLLFILLAAFLCNFSNPAVAGNIRSESFFLNNGMQVVIIKNTKVPAISHMLWYKLGSVDEPEGKSGVAHFLEHLMFKGTAKYGSGQFSKIIAKYGGNDNAFTGTDFTTYFQNIASSQLELVMDLESDRMQNLLFDEEEVIKERDVILEERNSRVDNSPRALLREQMMATLFLNHPYGTPIIGWRSEMEGLTLADARDFYIKNYSPNNAVLIISGDVDIEKVKPLAEKYYGNIKKSEKLIRRNMNDPVQISQRRVVLKDENVTQPEFYRYYMAPSQNTEGFEHCYSLILLSRILGEEATGRLYQELVVKQKVAANVSTYYDDVKLGPAIFAISAIPSAGYKIEDVEKAIDAVIKDILENSVTDEEIKRNKNALIAETIYAQEDLKTLAYFYGQALSVGLDVDYVEKWDENIKKVSSESIKKAATYLFDLKKSVTGTLLLGPRNNSEAKND